MISKNMPNAIWRTYLICLIYLEFCTPYALGRQQVGIAARSDSVRFGACTAQWRQHGHTTQKEAAKFGINCLENQGAKNEYLVPEVVLSKLKDLIKQDHPLTSLNPIDISAFCPAYPRLNRSDRANVWQVMLNKIAKQESNFETAQAYWEPGQRQYSIGLLQLSLSDSENYDCKVKRDVELADPDINLDCGVKIITRLIQKAGRIGGDGEHLTRGAAAYWSTLRSPAARLTSEGAPNRNSRGIIVKSVLEMPICRND